MRKLTYLAVLEPSKDGYGVCFPDLLGCIVIAITIHPDLIKTEMENKRVKTNVTIPSWLKELAEANQVNFSKLLETSLIEYLGIKSNSKY